MSSRHEAVDGNRPSAESLASVTDVDLQFRSTAYLRVLKQIHLYARARAVVILLEGESGTGKTWLARYIHRISSRATGPFEVVDLGALDDGVASSELFGHTAGAFTDARRSRAGVFVTASGGTLFLDEIGKASLAVQRKLLRAIESGEIRPVGADRSIRVDTRIIAASNIRLRSLVDQEKFLPDLFARLEVFRVTVPPLRQRRADIALLVKHYVKRRAAECGYAISPRIAPDLMRAIQRARWPNNLRQLDSTVHRLLIHADGAPCLTMELCVDDLSYLRPAKSPRPTVPIESVEQAVQIAGSLAGAARLLGRHRSTLYRDRERQSPPVQCQKETTLATSEAPPRASA